METKWKEKKCIIAAGIKNHAFHANLLWCSEQYKN